jgi:hypothetical protein
MAASAVPNNLSLMQILLRESLTTYAVISVALMRFGAKGADDGVRSESKPVSAVLYGQA